MEETNEIAEVKMNISMTAKGLAQWEVGVKFSTTEKASEELDKCIKQMKKRLIENNLKSVEGE